VTETSVDQSITVRIEILSPDGKYYSGGGTGILVDSTHVLTDQHVLMYDDGTFVPYDHILVVPDASGAMGTETPAYGSSNPSNINFIRGQADVKALDDIPSSIDIALITLGTAVTVSSSDYIAGLTATYDYRDLGGLHVNAIGYPGSGDVGNIPDSAYHFTQQYLVSGNIGTSRYERSSRPSSVSDQPAHPSQKREAEGGT